MKSLVLILLLSCAAWAQRDFLTAAEADQIREAQDPNARLQIYLNFARQRIDQVKSLMANGKPGRSAMIHDLLEDYVNILDAVDTVSDDALKHKKDVALGAKAVSTVEPLMLKTLEQLQESAPKDLARYDFVLKQAIGVTHDSIELAGADLGVRSTEVTARAEKEKKEIEAITATRKDPATTDGKKLSSLPAGEKPARKPPTLLRPGEKVIEP